MRVALALALIAVSLAGCSEGAAPEQTDALAPEFEQFEATETTGIIRGVVVDAAINPIPGVTVTIDATGDSTETTENGAFGFDGLDPGAYFLSVAKLGFLPVQSSAEVVAGDNEPPVVKVILERDASFNPYASARSHQGYYQCGLAFVVVCGAPNVLLGDGSAPDSSTYTFFFGDNPSFIQTEMVWESTQTVSPDLRFEVEADGSCDYYDFGNELGSSPLKLSMNETVLDIPGVGGESCGLYHSVFAGDILEQQHCFLWGSVPLVKCGVGFSLEQNFEWFISEFYGFTPPDDWWFIVDGLPQAPS